MYMYIVENSLQKTVIGVDLLFLHFTYVKKDWFCNAAVTCVNTNNTNIFF